MARNAVAGAREVFTALHLLGREREHDLAFVDRCFVAEVAPCDEGCKGRDDEHEHDYRAQRAASHRTRSVAHT
jgi:hypothetical protein